MQTSIWKTTIKLILLIITISFAGCEKESDNDGNSSLAGIWVRTQGASGDETNIAIGGISGEPEDRVYMCEIKGNVGLYKGYIDGNIITWDSEYGLPNASARMVGSQLEFYYPSLSFSLPTLYDSGSWSNNCGELNNTPKNIYYSWTTSSNCPLPAGNTLTFKYPNLPSNLSKDQVYGPVASGTIEIILDNGFNDPISYYNNLSEPPAGYKRIYTHIIFSYSDILNRCVFNFNTDDSSILTYVDQEL